MINVSFVDFYSTFDVEQNIFIYTLRKVLGEVAVIESNRYKESDIIIFSVFSNSIKTFPKKSKKGDYVDRGKPKNLILMHVLIQ